jgi:hypothetical protein
MGWDVRAVAGAATRPGRGRARLAGVAVALAVLVAGAGVGFARDDGGMLDFLREEAARRLPAAAAVATPPAAPARPAASQAAPARFAAIDRDPPARIAAAPAYSPRATTGRSVCVRLCDGYFFPLGTLASGADIPRHQEACEAACPHAPVALFTLAPGATDVARARGPDGVLYRALPQAFAHQRRRVAGCSCQGPDNIARGIDPLRDPTLRRGDVVVAGMSARAYAGGDGGFDDFRRSRALTPTARRQVDALLAVSSREATREAFMRTMRIVALEPPRQVVAGGAFAPIQPVAAGFGAVRTGAGASFVAVN